MARFHQTVEVTLAPDDVFTYLADQSNTEAWHPAIVSAERVDDGPPGVDTTTDMVFVFYTRDIELAYRLTEIDRPGRLVAEARSRRARARDEFVVEPGPDGGSIISWDSELVLGGLLRVFDRGLQIAFDGIGERAAAGLAEQLS